MLQKLHERMQGIFAAAIIFLICITFALWGIQNYLHGGSSRNSAVAKVGKSSITSEQLRLAFERTRREITLQNPTAILDSTSLQNLKKETLNKLIEKKVGANGINRLGLFIGPQQIEAYIGGMSIFQQNGAFSQERYEQVLSGMFFTEQEFIDELQNSVALDQLTAGIVNSSFFLPSELNNFVVADMQSRDIGYLLISLKQFLPKVKLTEADIESYYNSHLNEFMCEEKVSIDYLELKAEQIAKKIPAPSQDVLLQYYRDNIDNYSTPKKWKIVFLEAKINPGATEKELNNVRKTLENLRTILMKNNNPAVSDPSVRLESRTLSKAEMPAVISAEIEKLAPGQISNLITTPDGIIAIKLLSTIPAETTPFQAAKDKVFKAYQRQKSSEFFADSSNKLDDLAYTHSDSLAEASKELGLPILNTDEFTRKGSSTGIASNNKLVNAAYSDTVLKQGYNSGLIEVAPGDVVVLRIKKHIPAEAKPLKDVRNGIENKLQEVKTKEIAQSLADKIMGEVKDDTNYSTLAAKYELPWHILSSVRSDILKPAGKSSNEDGTMQEIIAAGFSLPLPTANHFPFQLKELANGDFAIVVALKAYDQKNANKDNQEVIAKQDYLKSALGQYEYELLARKWMRNTKIKIYDGNLTDLAKQSEE